MSIHDDMIEYNFKNKIAAYPVDSFDFSKVKGTLVEEKIVFKNVTLTNTGDAKTNFIGKITPTISGVFDVIGAGENGVLDLKDKNGVSVVDGVEVHMTAFNEYTIYRKSDENVTKDIGITIRFRVEDVTNYIIKG
jgi:hypothetical protein